jgi:hypothetical protein
MTRRIEAGGLLLAFLVCLHPVARAVEASAGPALSGQFSLEQAADIDDVQAAVNPLLGGAEQQGQDQRHL